MMAALLMAACGHRASKAGPAEGDSTVVGSDVFATDSISREKTDTAVSVKVSIHWPSAGNDSLTASIRSYICEEIAAGLTMEGHPDVVLYKDGQTAVDSTVSQQFRYLMDGFMESKANGIPFDGMQYSYQLRIFKLEETDTYVTYICNSEGFQGGAHGYATSSGLTFRKSDGRRIGYHTEFNRKTLQTEIRDQTLFGKPQSPQLAALIREGVRSYFQSFQDSTITDAELLDELIGVNSVDSIPLPSCPPYFTRQGLCFCYQQYEIAPYAAGMINFDIDYAKVRPLLSKEAASLLKK